jgi:hypothetical protein
MVQYHGITTMQASSIFTPDDIYIPSESPKKPTNKTNNTTEDFDKSISTTVSLIRTGLHDEDEYLVKRGNPWTDY